jgi:hypothetical protein
LYIAGILFYFIIRLRWGKFQTACKAVLDGLFDQIEYKPLSSPSE